MEASGLKKEDIYSVEIVGGSSRIPSIKSILEQVNRVNTFHPRAGE